MLVLYKFLLDICYGYVNKKLQKKIQAYNFHILKNIQLVQKIQYTSY
jgi:hypothetical protein